MTAHITLPRGAPTRTLGARGHGNDWVILGPNNNTHNRSGHGLFQTQLLFNEAMPASAYNRATRVGPPAPIVIEKLMARPQQPENADASRSSINFSALSEAQLLAALRLAKRDVRRRRHGSLNDSFKSQQQDAHTSHMDQEPAIIMMKSKASSPKENLTGPGADLLVYAHQELPVPPGRVEGLSPPTRDPGLGQLTSGQEPTLGLEIRKLQNGLEVYIQKIEQLNRGQTMEETLEPDEQHKVEIHQQKQAAHSARIIYGLQQQVKEIQGDLDKLRSQKIGHAKKSRVMERLAAAHRAAVRAMQVFIGQLPGPAQGRAPAHHKELGQLLRQLSLCSAKVEVDRGSAVPGSALDILQQLETLDIALSKQERPRRRRGGGRDSPPRAVPPPPPPPPRVPRGPTNRGPRRPRRAAGPQRSVPGRRAALQNPRATCPPPPPPPPVDRNQVLRDGLESLVQKELRENRHIGSEQNAYGKRGPLHLERNKMGATGFQQPTVSSRLRVNQLPQKELSVPWIPTSPHSPPAQRRSPQRSRPEPRCLFSPSKPSTSPPRQEFRGEDSEKGLCSDKKKQAQQEALRQAWLDKVAVQRLRRLEQLSAEEAEGIQRLRSEVRSPAQRDERAEQTARERVQMNEAQQIGDARNRTGSSLRHRLSEQAAERATESAEQLSEALLEDLLDDAARAAWAAGAHGRLEAEAERGLQAPTLESMLLRMDEIQRDQEEVRRRFATISYSDPLYWDRGEDRGSQWCGAPGSWPASPQPIRLTRPVARHAPTADIVLEKPVEAGHSVLSETSLTEEGPGGEQQQPGGGFVFPGPVERSRGTGLSVPGDTLKSIQRYREEHDAYLRLVAHEAVGSFNPWAVADSLAEELLSEALADVAAEFQDICEEYAEAVFTSEFLQPIQSPPASLPPVDSQ